MNPKPSPCAQSSEWADGEGKRGESYRGRHVMLEGQRGKPVRERMKPSDVYRLWFLIEAKRKWTRTWSQAGDFQYDCNSPRVVWCPQNNLIRQTVHYLLGFFFLSLTFFRLKKSEQHWFHHHYATFSPSLSFFGTKPHTWTMSCTRVVSVETGTKNLLPVSMTFYKSSKTWPWWPGHKKRLRPLTCLRTS